MCKNFREEETKVQRGLNKLPKVTDLMQHRNPSSFAILWSSRCTTSPTKPVCGGKKKTCLWRGSPSEHCLPETQLGLNKFLFSQQKLPAVSLYKILKRTFFKREMYLVIPLLGKYAEKIIIQKDTCTLMFTEPLLTIARTWEQPKSHHQRSR